MKKKYKDHCIDYYINECRKFNFYVGLIKYKLENRLKLTIYEEDILGAIDEYYYVILNIERIDDDEK